MFAIAYQIGLIPMTQGNNFGIDPSYYLFYFRMISSTYFTVLWQLVILSDILGLILFGALFFITIKNRKLHGACHLLIGLFSMCSLFSKMSTFLPYLFYMFPILNRVCAQIGLWLQFLPICLRYGIHPMMLSIGVDRMLSIFFPIWYSMRDDKFYLPFALSIPTAFLTYVTFIVAKDIQTQTNLGNFMGGLNDRNPLLTNCSLCFVVLTFFCYLFMLVKILCCSKNGNNSNSSIRQAIFKSLGLIVLIQCCGWLIMLIGRRAVANLDLDEVLKIFIINCLGVFISLATNSEIIVLYYTSSNHRMAFRKTFGWLFRIIPTLNNFIISPTAPIVGIHGNLNLNGISTQINNQQNNILCTTKF